MASGEGMMDLFETKRDARWARLDCVEGLSQQSNSPSQTVIQHVIKIIKMQGEMVQKRVTIP